MSSLSLALRNWKIHLLAMLFSAIAELIGSHIFKLGPASLVFIPLLYAFIFGAISGIQRLHVLTHDDMVHAAALMGITFFLLMARYGVLVGPNFWTVVESAPALILQELGNIGTVFFGIPVAIALGLRREAVGAAFSNAREPNLAIIGEAYGMDGPEGIGIMGVYVTGTVLGTLFCSLLSSFCASLFTFFSPQALAMASGTGSASMMAASLAPLVEMHPDIKEELAALASASNMCSALDGVYLCIFLSLPIANWLVRRLGIHDKPSQPSVVHSRKTRDQNQTNHQQIAACVLLCAIQSLICNWFNAKGLSLLLEGNIQTSIALFLQAIPGILILMAFVALGIAIHYFLPWKAIPAVGYIVTLGCILTIPGVPGAAFFSYWVDKVNFMALCTPILAYAGIAVGKDLGIFKKLGWRIVVVGLFVLTGTFIGSAVVAECVLRFTA